MVIFQYNDGVLVIRYDGQVLVPEGEFQYESVSESSTTEMVGGGAAGGLQDWHIAIIVVVLVVLALAVVVIIAAAVMVRTFRGLLTLPKAKCIALVSLCVDEQLADDVNICVPRLF